MAKSCFLLTSRKYDDTELCEMKCSQAMYFWLAKISDLSKLTSVGIIKGAIVGIWHHSSGLCSVKNWVVNRWKCHSRFTHTTSAWQRKPKHNIFSKPNLSTPSTSQGTLVLFFFQTDHFLIEYPCSSDCLTCCVSLTQCQVVCCHCCTYSLHYSTWSPVLLTSFCSRPSALFCPSAGLSIAAFRPIGSLWLKLYVLYDWAHH